MIFLKAYLLTILFIMGGGFIFILLMSLITGVPLFLVMILISYVNDRFKENKLRKTEKQK